ncbi:MAG: phosphopyruvate hydratase [Candidatus Falkowbacteria bacterium]|nr:phosphopyruvate hydratase [Candidatus Falkowbacteria bacterium]
MSKIKKIMAREILDGRAYPSLEVVIFLENGLSAKASAPSGIYYNTFEPKELRDEVLKNSSTPGVLRAIEVVEKVIAPALKGRDASAQEEIDDLLIALDGTEDKSHLGVNTIFAVSIACARAAAKAQKMELFSYLREYFNLPVSKKFPKPIFTMFNGGLYADTSLDFQEYLLLAREESVRENIILGREVYQSLGRVLRENGFDSDTGTEGGYAPNLDSSIQALEMIRAAAINSGYSMAKDFSLGIDLGASLFFDNKEDKYIFAADHQLLSRDNLTGIYQEWFLSQGVDYLEDPLGEERFSDWRELTASIGDRVIVAGDDLFASQSDRLRQGLKEKAANAMVIKPVQTGTLSEAVECVKLAKKYGYQVIISARGGETNDDFIADFSVAVGANWLKSGAPARGERVAKYNRLLEIEILCQENLQK